jgi:hypothetical protein
VARNSGLRLAAGANKTCANPVCQGPISDLLPSNLGKVWRRTPRKFCSKRCKTEGWILAKAAKILFKLEAEQWWQILFEVTKQARLKNRDHDKKQASAVA